MKQYTDWDLVNIYSALTEKCHVIDAINTTYPRPRSNIPGKNVLIVMKLDIRLTLMVLLISSHNSSNIVFPYDYPCIVDQHGDDPNFFFDYLSGSLDL